jgi:post-segregation antitoxin (ccd killing protein)
MKMTISVPDELYEIVKAADFNASKVCQRALRDHVERLQRLAELGEGMQRVEVYLERLNSDAAFTGRLLAMTDGRRNITVWAYLTSRNRIVIYNDDTQDLDEFDTFDELASDRAWRDGSPEFVAAIAEALGEKYIIELKI